MQFPSSADDLPQLLAVADSESYCMTDGNIDPVGFGQLWYGEPGSVHMMRIIVSPSRRSQGMGRELCRQLMARAMENGGPRLVTLRVYRDNPVAVALYDSMGFTTAASKSTGEALFMSMIPDNN